MTDVFLRVLNMSFSAGILALVVLLARCILAKRAPKRLFPILWGLVGIRLVLPFTVKSVMSLLPSAEVLPPEILVSEAPALNTGVTVIDTTSASAMSSLAPMPGDSVNPLQIWTAVGAVVWIAGAVLMFLYAVVSTWRLRRRMREAVLLDGNVYLSDRTDSPFVLGIVKPHIYVPFSIRDRDLPFVLAHERAHIARHDHWIKPAAFLLLSVYWFNPVLWIAYILLCRDVEMACDERVVKDYTPAERADYSEALLLCSVTRRAIAACPVAFGEVGVKKRIRTVLHYRRPAFWVTAASVLVVAVLAVCFLTDPVNAAIRNPAVGDYEPGSEGIVGSVDTTAFEEISPDFAIGADRY
ncbi:MAG: transcriptional regulator, partial [Clostridia bacterium]|nr:transcriptional regulator [Clostridia bacterium]